MLNPLKCDLKIFFKIMPEQQNIEYKQSWHDDYLKWVCGFENAQGGVKSSGAFYQLKWIAH